MDCWDLAVEPFFGIFLKGAHRVSPPKRPEEAKDVASSKEEALRASSQEGWIWGRWLGRGQEKTTRFLV